jgi:hypothetical protein
VCIECPSYTPTLAHPSITLSLTSFIYRCSGRKTPPLPSYRLVDVDGIGKVNIKEHPVYSFFRRAIRINTNVSHSHFVPFIYFDTIDFAVLLYDYFSVLYK